MALQGTLDSFALPDVLRLLAGTRKSGRLDVAGDGGEGRVWFGDGQLIAGEGPQGTRAGGVADVVFHLLRFESGQFAFEADALPDEAAGPEDVDAVIEQAEAQVVEWRDIELVVPSLRSTLSLRSELDDDDLAVSLTAAEWKTVVAIAGGTHVAALGEALDLDDLTVCRRLRDLVQRELVEVGDEVEADAPAPSPEAVEEPAYASDVFAEEDAPAGADVPAEEDAPAGAEVLAEDDVTSEVDHDLVADQVELLAGEGGVAQTARARLDVLAAAYVDDSAAAGLSTLMPEPLPGEAMTNGQLDDVDDAGWYRDDQPLEEAPAPVAETVPEAGPDADDRPVPEHEDLVPAVEDGSATDAADAADGDEEWDDDPADLGRQLSTLSPQAAAAIASAAGTLEDSRESSRRLGRRRASNRLR